MGNNTSPQRFERFVRSATRLQAVPHCPELELFLLDENGPLARAASVGLYAVDIPPPYWAFCWASGQVLARYLLDHPEQVQNKAVLDLGAGSGIAAIAAARSGAARVTAAERDPHGRAAIALNAAHNQVSLEATAEELVGAPLEGYEVLLAADVFYDSQAAEMTAWLDRLAQSGILVLIADPGRPALPTDRCELLDRRRADTFPLLESHNLLQAAVYRWLRPAVSNPHEVP